MAQLVEFLDNLLTEGEAVLGAPVGWGEPNPEAEHLLKRAFTVRRLELAGPVLEFDPQAALAAAEVTRASCWYLLNRQQRPEELKRTLTMPVGAQTAARHLSVDLTFCFLADVHRRAQGMDAADPLTELLAKLLCQWPLSGVLADLHAPPTGEVEFDGHPGLQMLYAERLVRQPTPGWAPSGGLARERAELVWQAHGKDPSLFPATASELKERTTPEEFAP